MRIACRQSLHGAAQPEDDPKWPKTFTVSLTSAFDEEITIDTSEMTDAAAAEAMARFRLCDQVPRALTRRGARIDNRGIRLTHAIRNNSPGTLPERERRAAVPA